MSDFKEGGLIGVFLPIRQVMPAGRMRDVSPAIAAAITDGLPDVEMIKQLNDGIADRLRKSCLTFPRSTQSYRSPDPFRLQD